MVLMRCVWHRRYFGYPTVYGVRSWRGAKFLFAEGRCRACAERRRAESHGDVLPAAPLIPPGLPRVALALALVSSLVLVARPVNVVDRHAAPNPSALPGAAPSGPEPAVPSPPVTAAASSPAPPPSPAVPLPLAGVPAPIRETPAAAVRLPASAAPTPATAPALVWAPPARGVRARAVAPTQASTPERAVHRATPGVEHRQWPARGSFVVLSHPAIPRAGGSVPVRLDSGCTDRKPERVAPEPSCGTVGPTAALPVQLGPGVQAP